jgi:predicted transcriptional regulator
MPTTTLKLPEDLKERVAAAAIAAGVTPHAFMVDAIARQIEWAERRREFVDRALAAEEEVATYGLVHDGDEVLSWFAARAAGRKPPRPRKRRL